MLPNDSVSVTPGSGVNIATQTINSKEYQAVINAGCSGHLLDSKPSYIAWANDVAFAGSKYHISILNATGSGKIVRVIKLFAVNVMVASATGVGVRFDMHRISAHSGGTAISVEKMDTANDAPPAGVTVRTGATSVTLGNRLFGMPTTGEEVGATTNLNLGFHLMQGMNLLFEADRIQELVLREGEGFAVRQITSSTAGTYGWLMVYTLE